MRRLFACAGVLALACAGINPASAETRWDLPSAYPESSFHTRNIAEFAKDVESRTGGSLKINIHPNQSLIQHGDIRNAVRQGIVSAGEFLVSRLEGENPVYAVDSVPSLAVGYDRAWKLYQAQKPFLERLFDREGIRLLYSVPWPPAGIYLKKNVGSVADLAGLKIRTTSKATERLAVLAGMVPEPIDNGDVAGAFRDGRLDAMMTSVSTGVDMKVWEFATVFVDLQSWLPRNVVIVKKQAYDSLSDAERNAVNEAASAAEGRGWEWSKADAAEKAETLKKNGVTILAPDDALKAAFAGFGATLADEWLATAGDDGKALIEAFRKD